MDNNTEIEHKYLVSDFDKVKKKAFKSVTIVQPYLSKNSVNTSRVRITNDNGELTAEVGIKSKKNGSTRKEFEYEIPLKDAKEMCENMSMGVVYKTRYFVRYKGKVWEIDQYHGANEGLIIAEIELKSEDEKYDFPNFVGKNITKEKQYSNSTLSLNEPKINDKYISDFEELIEHYKVLNKKKDKKIKVAI